MKELKTAEKYGQAIGISLGTLITKTIPISLVLNSVPAAAQTFAFVAIVLTAAKITETLASVLIDRSTLLRRLICGHSYIEGTWLDYVPALKEFGIISIRFIDGALTIHGDGYDCNGKPKGSWDSVMTKFDGTNLEYTYTCGLTSDGHVNTGLNGYSKIVFQRHKQQSAPIRWKGWFANFASKQVLLDTQGIRLASKDVADLLANPSECNRFLAQLGGVCQTPEESSSHTNGVEH